MSKVVEVPSWFEGEVYTEGAKVTNRFTGQSCQLDALELSIYDFIMGAQMCIEFRGGMTDPNTSLLQEQMGKAIKWFRQSSEQAYNVLLD
jgi:hypothetical protein